MADGDFFHGTQTEDVAQIIAVINSVNAGTVVLVGTAPDAPAGMVRVAGPSEAGQFGPEVFDGRTIPHALAGIFAQGAGNVIVINCATADHLAAVAAENDIIAGGRLPLANVPINNLVIETTADPAVVLVKGVDYSYTQGDKFVTILRRATYPDGTHLVASYNKFNSVLVEPADIIGGDVAGDRTGIALMDLIYARYQVTPKIIIAPVYSQEPTVLNALALQADRLRARIPFSTSQEATRDSVIASRGPEGDDPNFNTDNKRLIGLYPWVYKPDPLFPKTDGQPIPYDAYFAGVWSKSIADNGIGQSPSNLPVNGFTKLYKEVSCSLGDKFSDANILNTAGICTLYTGVGTRPRLWGNHNLSFVAGAGAIDSFMSQQLTQDVVDDSLLAASLQFQDKRLTTALIDTILSAVNVYLNSLKSSNDLIGGECTYDPAKNTPEQLATGKIVIDVKFVGPNPAENITFLSYIDITLFSQIGLAA